MPSPRVRATWLPANRLRVVRPDAARAAARPRVDAQARASARRACSNAISPERPVAPAATSVPSRWPPQRSARERERQPPPLAGGQRERDAGAAVERPQPRRQHERHARARAERVARRSVEPRVDRRPRCVRSSSSSSATSSRGARCAASAERDGDGERRRHRHQLGPRRAGRGRRRTAAEGISRASFGVPGRASSAPSRRALVGGRGRHRLEHARATIVLAADPPHPQLRPQRQRGGRAPARRSPSRRRARRSRGRSSSGAAAGELEERERAARARADLRRRVAARVAGTRSTM